MKAVKILEKVNKIKELDSDNVVLYFDNGDATIADKKTFTEKYANADFEDYSDFNELFYIVKRKLDNLKTLIYKVSGKYINENLWFTDIKIFNDKFFVITLEDCKSKTLIYQKDGEYFNPDICGEFWEIINDNYFKVSNFFGYNYKIVNKKQKNLISEETFSEVFDFDENLFIVKAMKKDPKYTFIKKDTGEYLNKDLYFSKWLNINDNICLLEVVADQFNFVTKSDGTIISDYPVLSSYDLGSVPKTDKPNEFIKVRFDNGSHIHTAMLRTSDCFISQLYYDIKPFNRLYFAAYLDDCKHFTLIRTSDFSLLCNHLCVSEKNITAYNNSDYFSIKNPDGTISIYN